MIILSIYIYVSLYTFMEVYIELSNVNKAHAYSECKRTHTAQ